MLVIPSPLFYLPLKRLHRRKRVRCFQQGNCQKLNSSFPKFTQCIRRCPSLLSQTRSKSHANLRKSVHRPKGYIAGTELLSAYTLRLRQLTRLFEYWNALCCYNCVFFYNSRSQGNALFTREKFQLACKIFDHLTP